MYISDTMFFICDFHFICIFSFPIFVHLSSPVSSNHFCYVQNFAFTSGQQSIYIYTFNNILLFVLPVNNRITFMKGKWYFVSCLSLPLSRAFFNLYVYFSKLISNDAMCLTVYCSINTREHTKLVKPIPSTTLRCLCRSLCIPHHKLVAQRPEKQRTTN